MNIRVVTTIIAGVFTSAAFGQETSRVFFFATSDTVQEVQEVATLIRAIGDVQIANDDEHKSLAIHGTPAQIALGEWLFNEMDKPRIGCRSLNRVPT